MIIYVTGNIMHSSSHFNTLTKDKEGNIESLNKNTLDTHIAAIFWFIIIAYTSVFCKHLWWFANKGLFLRVWYSSLRLKYVPLKRNFTAGLKKAGTHTKKRTCLQSVGLADHKLSCDLLHIYPGVMAMRTWIVSRGWEVVGCFWSATMTGQLQQY